MQPAGFFPRKNQTIAIGPVKLIGSDHGMERAAGAFIGAPDLAALAGREIGDANRPGSERLAHGTGSAGAVDAGDADNAMRRPSMLQAGDSSRSEDGSRYWSDLSAV